MNERRASISLTGHGFTRQECLDEIIVKAKRYFGVEDQESLLLGHEEAREWCSNYSGESMFEVTCLVSRSSK